MAFDPRMIPLEPPVASRRARGRGPSHHSQILPIVVWITCLVLAACAREADDWLTDLQGDDAFARAMAAAALGRSSPGDAERVIPALLQALADEDDEVRAWADTSLRALAPFSLAELAAQVARPGDGISGAHTNASFYLAEVGAAGVPFLMNALKDPTTADRWSVVMALVRVGADAVPALLDAAQTTDTVTLAFIIVVLEQTPGGADHVPRLVGELAGPRSASHAPARLADAFRLAGRHSPAIVRVLVDQSPQWKPQQREAVLPALVQGLLLRVARGDREVRVEAVGQLTRLGSDAVPPLIAALEHADAEIAAWARKALAMIGPKALRQLLSSLRPGHAFHLRTLETVASIMGPEAALPVLGEYLEFDDPVRLRNTLAAITGLGPAARPLLQRIVPLFEHADAATRDAARVTADRLRR
ncbi:MAG: hypothetical protein CMJ83_01270 [Planctomycetes bacterium]|nr:hypothetical protein [Planctomycetota bacterium]